MFVLFCSKLFFLLFFLKDVLDREPQVLAEMPIFTMFQLSNLAFFINCLYIQPCKNNSKMPSYKFKNGNSHVQFGFILINAVKEKKPQCV